MKKSLIILLGILISTTVYCQVEKASITNNRDSIIKVEIQNLKDSLSSLGINQSQISEEIEGLDKFSWLDFITLLLALIGGITGAITILNHYSNRAKFFANVQSTVFGGGDDGAGNEYQSILYFLFITNKGEEPIVPVFYQLRIKTKTNSKWLNFEPMIIPENFDTFTINGTTYSDVLKQDLSFHLGAIKKGDVLNGALMFASFDATKDDIAEGNILEYELICTDVTKKKYKHRIKSESLGNLPKNRLMPIHNIGS